MGKPKSFTITVSNGTCVYFPGQTIEGCLNLELSEEMEMKGITIRFVGAAKVKWSEGGGKNRRTYTNYESYISDKKEVFGREQSGREKAVKQPGVYNYPFSFKLPRKCPSSFETNKGHVRYYVQGVIGRPWKFDIKTTCVFTVLTELDLNKIKDAEKPVLRQGTKSGCCLCCTTGPVRVMLDLPKMGYLPGETIVLKAEVSNDGRRKYKDIFAEFVMRAKCYGNAAFEYKTGIDEEVIASVARGPLIRGETVYYNNEEFVVPPLPTSQLPGCEIIDILYTVRIRAVVSGLGGDLIFPADVTIGSTPFSQTQTTSVPGTSVTPLPITRPPPPSYNAYILGETTVEIEGDTKEEDDTVHVFTPKYAYYDFSAPETPQSTTKL